MGSIRFSIVFAVSVGLILTTVSYTIAKSWEQKALDAEFERRVGTHLLNLQSKIDLHVEILESIAGLFAASDGINRKEFRNFVSPILERYTEVQGYSWNPLIKDALRSDFESSARKQGFKGFQITQINQQGERVPARKKAEYVTVFLLEPLAGNEKALGYDISSEKIRELALKQARATGRAITTDWIRLVQEQEEHFGVLIVRPIYTEATLHKTTEARRRALKGYVVGVFRIGDMIEQALRPSNPAGLDFWVFEGDEARGSVTAYFHPSRSRIDGNSSAGFEQFNNQHSHSSHQILQLPGKKWSIVYAAAPALVQSQKHFEAIGVLFVGLALTGLLSVYLLSVKRKSQLTTSLNVELREKIIQHQEAESALRESESYNRMLFEKSTVGLVLSDSGGKIKDANHVFASILGRTVEEAKLLNYWDLTPVAYLQKEKEEFVQLAPFTNFGPYEKEYAREDGTLVPVRQTSRLFVSGNTKYILSSVEDISTYKKARERIDHLAFHDSLTNLPNRELLHDRLEHSIDLAVRNHQSVGVMFLDIDRFKTINDSLGHRVGDQLLVQVAERLSKTVRQSDTVARFGGDEFIIVAEGISSQEQLDELAKLIIQKLAAPFQVDTHKLFTSTSIGISMSHSQNSKAEELITQADIAMYEAKAAGRNTYRFHKAEMGQNAAELATMERDLHGALERGEMLVYLQPITDLSSTQTSGFEALMRWQHPVRNLVNPGEFIPVMEDSGMIIPASRWMLQQSCQSLKILQSETGIDLSIAVNLSAPCFYDSGLVEFVEMTLKNSQLSPQSLILELTESTLFRDPEGVRPTMDRLKEIGVRIALDDFGTGQSSLNHLRNFPIDIVKIDREFIHNIPNDTNDCELVSAIIAMAHNLNMKVIAEGVELKSQLEYLNQKGCDKVQGYFYSPPRPIEEAIDYLQRHSKGKTNKD